MDSINQPRTGMQLYDAEGRRLYLTEDERRAFITAGAKNVATHNLKPQPPLNVPCLPNCDVELTAFFVYKSGKSRLKTDIPEQIAAERQRKTTIYSSVIHDIPSHGAFVIHFLMADGYRREVLQAVRQGIPIKCCFLCRYAGLDAWEKPVFCKIRRIEVGANEAVGCSAYRPEISR
jgi:hypothetical protein